MWRYEMDLMDVISKYGCKDFEINKAKRLVDDMSTEVEKYTQLLELAKQNYVDTIKANIRYEKWTLSFDEVGKWLCMLKTEKIDKRKKYNEKLCYDFINSELRDLLEDDSIEVVSVSSGGWESYYYSYEFKTNKDSEHKYYLSIPNAKSLNVENISNAYDGMLALFKVEGFTHNMIESSYDESDIKKAYKDLWNKGE